MRRCYQEGVVCVQVDRREKRLSVHKRTQRAHRRLKEGDRKLIALMKRNFSHTRARPLRSQSASACSRSVAPPIYYASTEAVRALKFHKRRRTLTQAKPDCSRTARHSRTRPQKSQRKASSVLQETDGDNNQGKHTQTSGEKTSVPSLQLLTVCVRLRPIGSLQCSFQHPYDSAVVSSALTTVCLGREKIGCAGVVFGEL